MFLPIVLQQTPSAGFDVTSGALQVGYRVISGKVPSADKQVTLTAWAVVFPQEELAAQRYADIVEVLGYVGADGLILQHIAGVDGASFGSLSERANLIDTRATVWVSSPGDESKDRGAVLASTQGDLVRFLATSTYLATGPARAVHLLETLVMRMSAREHDLKLPPAAATMARLPILADTFALMTDAIIEANRYTAG